MNKFQEDSSKAGIVYLSSIPSGMAPHDIRTHLSPFGAIGRLYLAPSKRSEDAADMASLSKQSKKRKAKNIEKLLDGHKQKTHFVEGWVEFTNKRDAKTAALALNGTPVRSTNPRQRDSLWCVKYLSSFKWINLTEQLALDRATKEKRLKAERRRARRENEHYLGQVEKAQARKRAEAKKAKEEQSTNTAANDATAKSTFEDLRIKFKQRKPILK